MRVSFRSVVAFHVEGPCVSVLTFGGGVFVWEGPFYEEGLGRVVVGKGDPRK